MSAIDTAIMAQLKAMVEGGLSAEEAAEAFQLDVDAVKDYLAGEYDNRELSADDLIKRYKPQMVKVLASIAMDETLENVAARVAAAKVFVEGKGEIPDLPINKLSDAYKKMKETIERQQLVKTPVTVTTPSPSTSIVNVDNELAAKLEANAAKVKDN